MGASPAAAIDRRAETVIGAGIAFVALMVYVATLAPSLAPGDSGDLTTAAATLGIAHPPGYPLFSIVGHLFTLLPFGSPAFRVNLMSAVADAIAVGVVAILIGRIVAGVRHDRPGARSAATIAAIVGAAFLGFATEFWRYSLVAEVFALNNLFAAILLLLSVTWYQNPHRRWALRWFFLTSGLAFCNQQTIVLLAPGLGALVLAGAWRLRMAGARWGSIMAREVGVGIVLILLGLLPYLYLPLAAMGNPPALWGDPSTLDRFIAVVTRSDYGSFSLVGGGTHGDVGTNLGALARYLFESFGPVGSALALAGLWWLARHRPIVGLALALAFFVSGPLFLAYANPPTGGLMEGVFARFYILPTVPFAAIVGCGAFWLVLWVTRLAARVCRPSAGRLRLAVPGALAIALAVSVAGPAAAHYSSVDQSGNRMTINFVRDLLAPLDPSSILLTEGDTAVLGTWYAQSVEGYRSDVVVVAVPLLHFQWYIDQVRRQHPDISIPFEAEAVAGRPVTDKIVNANFDRRPVYYVGVIDEAFPSGYGELRTGFARKFVRAADAADPFAFVRAHTTELDQYHFPTQAYPTSSWENWESSYYSGAAFDLANAYETIDVPTAEQWYRTAITLGPQNSAAYKDLAILLSANGGRPGEIADLLERYLVLAPQDPEAAKIRASIAQLRAAKP